MHEHREKVQQEKERQREIKEQMREEERARKEVERVEAEAAKEEQTYQKALEQARTELEAAAEASAEIHDKLEAQVSKLEIELKDAIDKKAKAVARAQLTRAGHVYVISNIGSCGEGIYKIGMTRRFEPLLRVKELGDASAPFPFDVHATGYSDDAPTLENLLHHEFSERRVNKVNTRKEFFRVSLDEIRKAVTKHFGVITFVTVPEAEEYRKTVAADTDGLAQAS